MAKKVARVLRIDTLTGPTGGQTGRTTVQLQKVKEQDDRLDTTETKRILTPAQWWGDTAMSTGLPKGRLIPFWGPSPEAVVVKALLSISREGALDVLSGVLFLSRHSRPSGETPRNIMTYKRNSNQGEQQETYGSWREIS